MAPEPQLHDLLHRAAGTPVAPLDLADLGRRARRIRRNRRLGTAATVLALMAPVAVAGRVLTVPETSVGFLSGGPGTATPRPEGAEYRPPPAAERTPQAGVVVAPSPAAKPGTGPVGGAIGTPTPTRTGDGRESYATVTIQDPPGAPERRPDLPGDPRHPDVVLSLVLDRTSAGPDDVIDAWLDVRNTGDEPIELGRPRCWALWGLYQEGTWRGGQPDSTCGDRAPTHVIEPGQRWSISVRLDTRTAGADGRRGPALAPGTYQAAAGLRVETREHEWSGVWYAPPVDVTVTG